MVSDSTFTNQTVLLVDDLRENLDILEALLDTFLPGLRHLAVLSASQALQTLSEERVDLIVADARMPGIDGFELCRRIKADPAHLHIPVLMVSGVMLESRDKIKGLASGADGYLCKPFEPEEFILQIKALLRLKSNQDRLQENQAELESSLMEETAKLRIANERLRMHFERSPDPIVVVDEDTRILESNPAAEAFLDTSHATLQQSRLDQFVPKDVLPPFQRALARWLTGNREALATYLYAEQHHRVPVDIRAGTITLAQQPALLLHVRDTKATKSTEAALRYRLALDQLIMKIATEFIGLGADDYDSGIHRMLQLIGEFAGVDRSYLFLFDETGLIASNTHEWCAPGIASEQDNYSQLPTEDAPWLFGRLRTGETLRISGLDHLPPEAERERKMFEDSRLLSLLLVPLMDGSHCLGCVGFDGVGRHIDWPDDFVNLLKTAGGVLANVIQRQRAEQRQITMIEGLHHIVECAHGLVGATDIDHACQLAVETARRDLGIERAAIFLHDHDQIHGTYGTDHLGRTTDERNMPITPQAQRTLFTPPPGPSPAALWHIEEDVHTYWDGSQVQELDKGWTAITPILGPDRKPMGVFSNDTAITGAPIDPVRQELVAVFCSMLGGILALKRTEAERGLLARALEQSDESVIITNTEGIIQYVNPGFEQITGFAREEVIGRTPAFLKSGKMTPEDYREIWTTLRSGASWSGRMINRDKRGELFEVEETISPIRDSTGKLLHFVSVAHDITREARLEDEIRQAQKMEGIGRLAGGIAHDFNNLLTAILGYGRMVRDESGPDSPLYEDAREIVRAAERAARLTRQLLAFGRRQPIRLERLDLNKAVMDMNLLLKRTLGEDIRLHNELDPDLPPTLADTGFMEQVIMNLAVNARDAMPEGGELAIRTEIRELDELFCRDHVGVKPGSYAVLIMRDSGMGMTSTVRERIFDPFFTTKEEPKGTGLGLSTVYGIMKQLNGYIELDSEAGQGTEFRIYFPATDQAEVEPPENRQQPPPRGTETIVVVEDEDTVRHYTARVLRHLGYKVLEAHSGQRAIEVCRLYEQPIDLILSDVVMPYVRGPEMIRRLRESRSDFQVLYMTGFTPEALREGGEDIDERRLLSKPFSTGELAGRVRDILDGIIP